MTWPLLHHVWDVAHRRLVMERRLGNEPIRPGEFADAVIIALCEREHAGVFDLPWREPYLTVQAPPSLAQDQMIVPMLRRHWRDWVINDVPTPGTWRGWLYCLRNNRRDLHAAFVVAETMEWDRGNDFVTFHYWRCARQMFRWRPLAVDVLATLALLFGAVWWVGG